MPLTHILVTPTAQEDLKNARDYLNEQRDGLGDEFLDEFVEVATPLLVYPELYQPVRGKIRRGIMKRFHYLFTYTIQDDSIVIARVIHTSRNKKYY